MSWLLPAREATAEQLAATGAAGASTQLVDPLDGDRGFRLMGAGPREQPEATLEKLRAYSVAAYRLNPMARAIVDTFTSFCVGDSGVTLQCTSDEVRPWVDRFWRDPRNRVADVQELLLRDHLLMGETVLEMLVGASSGVTRYSLIDPSVVAGVELVDGNPLWPGALRIRRPASTLELSIVQLDDLTGLRSGQVQFWASFKALATDRRGSPFLGPVVDWLDSYDQVLSNLIDRTALARYLVWDVTLTGADQDAIDEWVRRRGGQHAPRSGTVEAHNESVEWKQRTADTGSYEDANTARTIMTSIAAGAGLAKTWLAEPEDANRATSLTMAEPVRRRVGGVQKTWLGYITELARFAVDQYVAAGRIPAEVDVAGPAQQTMRMAAADTVAVTGPEIAAADAQVTSEVLQRLSQALQGMVAADVMTAEAAREAARKAWEDYMGVPYQPELDAPDADPGDVATAVDEARTPRRVA